MILRWKDCLIISSPTMTITRN